MLSLVPRCLCLMLVLVVAGLSTVTSRAESPAPIDRRALVARHRIVWDKPNGTIPLGNGEFCFNADATGLQTFAGNSLAHWGWHSFPLPAGLTAASVPSTGTFQQGRNRGPDEFPPETEALRGWMFDNPHIMNLGRLRLMHADGRAVMPAEITSIDRSLNLWTGLHTARYQLAGTDVKVETCVHPSLDMVAVHIESPLVASGELQVVLDCPYPTLNNSEWIGNFSRTEGHATATVRQSGQRIDFLRTVDAETYRVALEVGPECVLQSQTSPAANGLLRVSAQGAPAMSLVCAFYGTDLPDHLPTFASTKEACAAHWEAHWTSGGAIDLSGSSDPRWRELERRIVLSQYLMAAMASGSFPTSENGLVGIDPWRGQFHMEMLWWHLAHYGLWDRWHQAEEALGCYRRFTPSAAALATQLGYRGLQWPKSVGPEGRSAPWIGNQVLLWKQPHPIFMAELEYRLRPTRATLEKWADIIEGTADYMADYPTRDAATGVYSLAPSMPPSEQGITRDDVFDLAYWRWGLDRAQVWRQRMGKPPVPLWEDIRRNLTPLPVHDGVFVHSPEWTNTYPARAVDHPDPIGVLGMLPPMESVDGETAHRTVLKVWQTWDWKKTWGWDFPWMAMAAARVGEPQLAVDALLLESEDKNSYDARGLNGGWYLPGNGGLLYATAMMAAGWDGGPTRNAPGFPADGTWTVKWEGLRKAP